MFVKKKNIPIIIFSSLIIAVTIVCTLVGHGVYIQWKKDTFALKYRSSIYKMTADLFGSSVMLSNVYVSMGEGAFFDVPVFEGSVKNNSKKTITSMLIEVSFQEPDGTVIYKNWVHPLGEQHYGRGAMLQGVESASSVLLPGEGITFRYILKNCPDELIEQVSSKSGFAKSNSWDKISMSYSITGMKVI